MEKKEIMALLLAGGQGSRLGILTKNTAKPAVRYGGKYRIIDFPLSNCINSGIDTVGVLTQYQPLMLNQHIGIGIPWDLDRKSGGVTILAPHVKAEKSLVTGLWERQMPFIIILSISTDMIRNMFLFFPATIL